MKTGHALPSAPRYNINLANRLNSMTNQACDLMSLAPDKGKDIGPFRLKEYQEKQIIDQLV